MHCSINHSCRYKHFTFNRAKRGMCADATKWLKETFKADWMPKPNDVASAVGAKRSAGTSLKGTGKNKKMSALANLMMEDDSDEDGDHKDDVSTPDEVEAYLSMPQVSHVSKGVEFNLLDWWKKHAHMFPNLSRMARQFLALPACSSGVERLFSAVGRMHDDFRKNSKEVTLQHLTIVYKNLP